VIHVDHERCCYCSGCVPVCLVDAIHLDETDLQIDPSCIDCNLCLPTCPVGALYPTTVVRMPLTSLRQQYDVVVVGAGPGGCIAAETAARRGLSVLLVEKRQKIGSPVRCAEGVNHASLVPFVEPDPRWVSVTITGEETSAVEEGQQKSLRFEDGNGQELRPGATDLRPGARRSRRFGRGTDTASDMGHQSDGCRPKRSMIVYRKALGLLNLTLLLAHWNLWRIHPRRFWIDVDTAPIDRPIFLLGVQGGGLTLIARMLRRHPDAVSVTGNSRYWAGPDEMQNVMGAYLPPELTGLHHKVPPHPGFPRRDGLYAIDELLPLYRKTDADATVEMSSRFQRAIRLAIAIHAKYPQQARFIDKSQTFTVRLSLVNSLLREHQPYFILVTRNPYAMCYRTAAVATPLSRLDLSLEERLQLAAQHWDNSFRCALADSREVDHFRIIRFEDLLQKPETWLQDICAFAGLSYYPSMLPRLGQHIPLGSTGSSKGDHKWYPLRPDVNRSYLKQLEPWMVKIIGSRVGKLARQWWYSPDGP
jgi:NAD-dependent dihydropyrimidine dehydrogenase PreA subunit